MFHSAKSYIQDRGVIDWRLRWILHHLNCSIKWYTTDDWNRFARQTKIWELSSLLPIWLKYLYIACAIENPPYHRHLPHSGRETLWSGAEKGYRVCEGKWQPMSEQRKEAYQRHIDGKERCRCTLICLDRRHAVELSPLMLRLPSCLAESIVRVSAVQSLRRPVRRSSDI